MKAQALSGRLTIVTAESVFQPHTFAEDVATGLAGSPKSLPCQYLYDEIGSHIFEEICDLPEYYLTRSEREILSDQAGEIARGFPNGAVLVELGSGSSIKTRFLIEAFLAEHGSLHYDPIDISSAMLKKSSLELLEEYETLEIHAVAGEYQDGLEKLRSEEEGDKLVLFLGSTIGNFEREDAARFLSGLAKKFAPGDRLLIGADLRKDSKTIEAAYNDDAGTTARFNLNLLARINRELGGNFDLSRFRHCARYLDLEGRVEIHIESLCAQTVRVELLDRSFDFARGELIHTENSHKFSIAEISAIIDLCGMRIIEQWVDSRELFSLTMAAPKRGR